MPHVASAHERHVGSSIDDGHCVAFVRKVTGLPPTSLWRRGDPVQGTSLAPGTAIATFDPGGTYGNHLDTRSHAAILHAVHDDGSITVFDQWVGQPVQQRVIRNRGGAGGAANDSSRFDAIEVET